MHLSSIKYSEKTLDLANHFHNSHQIIYIVSGEISITVNGKSYIASSGSLVILSLYEEHSINILSEEYKRYTLSISSEPGYSDSDENLISAILVNRPENFSHIIPLDENEIFEKLLKDMAYEYTWKAPMYKDVLDAKLKQFLICLYRYVPELFSPDNSENTPLVYKIQNNLEKNYNKDISLETLSNEYHLSRYHLSRVFKSVTGYSPIEYLITCRLFAAKKYLCTTNLSIKEIIDLCGFSDESNFSRMFRKRTGLTPSQFRKENKI